MPANRPNFFLINPVATTFFITDRFNAPRNYPFLPHKKQLHEGIDLRAVAGGQVVAVRAAQRGVVDGVGFTPEGYGNWVRLRHDWHDGGVWFTWYGHLSSISVREGDFLLAGTPLGMAGNTGNVFPPPTDSNPLGGTHLHLTVVHQGHGLPGYVVDDVVNPEPLFNFNGVLAADMCGFVEDLTVPDGALVQPGQTFVKRWRVRNLGTTTWGAGYELVHSAESRLAGPAAVPLPPLAPGQFGEVAVTLVAPDAPGRVRSVWIGRNPSGERFPFDLFADIEVVTAPRRDDAIFLADVTIPDGTVLAPGQSFLKQWRVRNVGDTAWSGDYRLAFYEDDPLGAPLTLPVPYTRSGAEAVIGVSLTAPSRPGSYKSTWRLRNAQGQFFGAVYFADIAVTQAREDILTFVDDVTIPDGTRVTGGQTFDKVWRVRNAGTTSWGDGYRVVHIEGDPLGGPPALPLPAAAPGATVDIAVTLTAPRRAGTYRSVWDIVNPDGVAFGHVTAEIRVIAVVMTDDARFVADVTIPDGTAITAGDRFRKAWRIRNTGTTIWGPGYALVHAGLPGDYRMDGPDSVPAPLTLPGQEADLTVELVAPPVTGLLRSTWQLRGPDGALFGDIYYAEIRVAPGNEPVLRDDARLAAHETIPNGSRVDAGETFVKRWAIRNTGTTTWGAGYALAFVRDDRLAPPDGGPDSVAVPETAPDGVARVAVTLQAPLTAGSYRGTWRMRNAAGKLFGSGLVVSIAVPVSAETALDLLPYLRGDGRLYNVKAVIGGQEFNEVMQTQLEGKTFFHTKNRLWEELFYDDDYIYRGTDTSPGNHPTTGQPYFYTLRHAGRHGSPWLRRVMRIGDLHNQQHVVIEAAKNDCRVLNQYYHSSYMKLLAHHERRRFEDGVELEDVIELTWLLRPDATPTERYFYARGYGLVGWEGSAGRSGINRIFAPGGGAPNIREALPCLPLLTGSGLPPAQLKTITPRAPVPASMAP